MKKILAAVVLLGVLAGCEQDFAYYVEAFGLDPLNVTCNATQSPHEDYQE